MEKIESKKPNGKKTKHGYLKKYEKTICKEQLSELWLMGAKTREVDPSKIPDYVSVIGSIEGLLDKLQALKKS